MRHQREAVDRMRRRQLVLHGPGYLRQHGRDLPRHGLQLRWRRVLDHNADRVHVPAAHHQLERLNKLLARAALDQGPEVAVKVGVARLGHEQAHGRSGLDARRGQHTAQCAPLSLICVCANDLHPMHQLSRERRACLGDRRSRVGREHCGEAQHCTRTGRPRLARVRCSRSRRARGQCGHPRQQPSRDPVARRFFAGALQLLEGVDRVREQRRRDGRRDRPVENARQLGDVARFAVRAQTQRDHPCGENLGSLVGCAVPLQCSERGRGDSVRAQLRKAAPQVAAQRWLEALVHLHELLGQLGELGKRDVPGGQPSQQRERPAQALGAALLAERERLHKGRADPAPEASKLVERGAGEQPFGNLVQSRRGRRLHDAAHNEPGELAHVGVVRKAVQCVEVLSQQCEHFQRGCVQLAQAVRNDAARLGAVGVGQELQPQQEQPSCRSVIQRQKLFRVQVACSVRYARAAQQQVQRQARRQKRLDVVLIHAGEQVVERLLGVVGHDHVVEQDVQRRQRRSSRRRRRSSGCDDSARPSPHPLG
eukprot:Unigene16524_Nuclearia_a/m.48890 Unigene16524_Nuclearia_a/g.48890  ORF Unigene16524_Nuclearia_a/g.48890 Unigene16524_Nuclearia_a/m.48890 type:complete len:538 (-) Unigene16524_Nuclearia_a:140-1753(-)